MNNIDQEFIEFVVKSLVGKPEAVVVDRRIDEKGVLLELTVDPEDLGRVIGKRGATAQSLRTLLRALGTKNDARYNLKIIDNGVGDHAHHGDGNGAPAAAARSDSADDNSPVSEPVSEPVVTPKPADNVADEKPEPAPQETTSSDRMRQTRAELADLDDLDV